MSDELSIPSNVIKGNCVGDLNPDNCCRRHLVGEVCRRYETKEKAIRTLHDKLKSIKENPSAKYLQDEFPQFQLGKNIAKMLLGEFLAYIVLLISVVTTGRYLMT